jgi:hypothetical protein
MSVSQARNIYYDELEELNILSRDGCDIVLNVKALSVFSTVVDDQMYGNFTDINWMREQRKALGFIKNEVKDEEYRREQQARRKKRRAFAKEQRAKRLAQPSEQELSLDEILFH